MKQAKTLTKAELKQVIDVWDPCNRYVACDITMLLLTLLCGLRIGHVKNLCIANAFTTGAVIRTDIRLDDARTKINHEKNIFGYK
ncbi:site-specific integrase [Alphaproteobacteria bacterium]|nr:site-specific integrase [Alphaproteobacteria bacterium]